MQFHAKSLSDLPVDGVEYYVHVIDLSDGPHLQWVNQNLATLDLPFGPETGLVSGPVDLSEEVFRLLSRSLWPHLPHLEDLLRCTTCLVISEGHLAHTRNKTYLGVCRTFRKKCRDEHILLHIGVST